MLTEPLGSLFLSLTTDFSNHDNALGLWIINKSLKHINEVSTIEWIAANSNDG